MISINKHIYFYTILFLLLAVFSLNLNYIEGDDARTILYHALGRNTNLQPPYSAYHSMFDKMFSLLPTTNEIVLRKLAIGLTFLFTFFKLSLISLIVKLKLKDFKSSYYLLVIPFLIPDILFTGLIINPTNISITFILLAHFLFIKYLKNNSKKMLILGILLFGFGVSFRWITAFYGFVFFAEYITKYNGFKEILKKKEILKIISIFVWFPISFIFFIQLSGFSVFDIISVYKDANKYISNSETSLLTIIARGITFISPGLIVFFVIGIISLVFAKKYKTIVYFFISLFPYFITGIYPSYKYIITIIVPIIIICFYGFNWINTKYKLIPIVIIFLPWIIGVQLELNSVWGPGFELKNKNYKIEKVNNFNPDKGTKINKINLGFYSGTALPTPEGPRPIYGYAYVFFHDWKEFVKKFNLERENAVEYSKNKNVIILQDVNHSFVSSKLIEKEYNTKDSFNKKNEKGHIEREFFIKNNKIQINVFQNKKMLLNKDEISSFLKSKKEVLVFSSYTNIISKMKKQLGENFSIKGAYWGVIINDDWK